MIEKFIKNKLIILILWNSIDLYKFARSGQCYIKIQNVSNGNHNIYDFTPTINTKWDKFSFSIFFFFLIQEFQFSFKQV